jgi:tetratricopeptide (TPR) repeat protein
LSNPVIPAASLALLLGQLQDRLRAEPEDWASYASLGLAYVQQARVTADPTYYPKAEGVLERSLALHPDDNFDALLGMGALDLARHDFTGALAFGQRAQGLNPHNGGVYGVIGDALLELGRYDEAFSSFQEMIDRRPDLSSYARVSYARELQGDVAGAIHAMELALESASGSAADAAWVSYQLGELYFNDGALDRAERSYRRGLVTAPAFVANEAGLAKVAAARGNLRAAIRGYEGVVERYPSVEYVIALGDLYTLAGRSEEAERQYDLVGALEQIARSSGVNTDLEFALFHANQGTDLREALARARAEYQRRKSVHVDDALAWTLYASGRFAEAERYADQALRLGYRDATFHFHAGMIAAKTGDTAAARRLLRRALSINPYFSPLMAPIAERTLARLGPPS